MKEYTSNITLTDELLEYCRNRTLEVTGVDVFRLYKGRPQHVVEARICFIATIFLLLTNPKNEEGNFGIIAKKLHLDRSTGCVHKKNFFTDNKIPDYVKTNVNEIKQLVTSDLTFSIPIKSILDRLTEYETQLNIELNKIQKLLQTLREDERKTA
jgi:hypothetical protein